nr:hypothetical protein TIFTF001_048427 [Ficus carica]
MEAGSFFGPDTRLVYKHYATLYFVFLFDSSENELAMLDLIQGAFLSYSVSWYNLLMHTMLDEIIFGGQVLETSSSEVMKAVEEISKYTTALCVRDSFEFYIIPCPKICFWLAESVANVHR